MFDESKCAHRFLLSVVISRTSLAFIAFLLVIVVPGRGQEAERQFDFWVGEWNVTNRFLQDDGTWVDAGSARNQVFPVLGGRAVMELWDGTIYGGRRLVGFSVRYYDAESESWRLVLNWPQPDSPTFFELDGRFRHGRGEFFRSFEDSTGTDVRVRYTFSDISPERFRWDQALSRDGGQTWTTSWIMEFSRTAEQAAWPMPGEAALTYTDGSRCSSSEARRFDDLNGIWEGTIRRRSGAGWSKGTARVRAYRILDGCAILEHARYEDSADTAREMHVSSYIPSDSVWQILYLDDRPEAPHTYSTGRWMGDTFEPDGDGVRWLNLSRERADYDIVRDGRVISEVRLTRSRP